MFFVLFGHLNPVLISFSVSLHCKYLILIRYMLVKTKAIVLHSFKYSDSRLIVDLFTRESGRMAIAVTISSSRKGKFTKMLFQPLTLLDIEVDIRQNAQLQKIKEATVFFPMTSIPFEQHKLSIALFVAEFLYHALKGEQANAHLFDYIEDSIRWLDYAVGDYANFHIVFLLRLTLFLGFMPNLEGYAAGDLFDLRNSSFVSVIPPHRDYLASDEASLVNTMTRMNYRTMTLFQMSHNERNRLLDILILYYRLHLPDFPELRSLSVLREIYS